MDRVQQVKAVLALGTLSGALWAGTFASFSDTQTATSTFTTGTLDLRLNGDATTSYGFTTLSLSNIKPGDDVYAPLTVSNNGTLPYTYTMTSSATNPDGKSLKDQLQAGARLVANTGLCTSGGYAAGTTVIAAGSLSAAAISTPRSVAAGSSEVLCFHVSLDVTTGNAYQGATTTSTMNFSASQ